MLDAKQHMVYSGTLCALCVLLRPPFSGGSVIYFTIDVRVFTLNLLKRGSLHLFDF